MHPIDNDTVVAADRCEARWASVTAAHRLPFNFCSDARHSFGCEWSLIKSFFDLAQVKAVAAAPCCERDPSRSPAMLHPALTVIRAEHNAFSAMLRSIRLLLAAHRRHGTLPDFPVLRAMLFYVDEFPERLHHPKETELLFPMLRTRSAEAVDTLDRLDRDHADGQRAIRDLEHDLLAFEMMGESRRERFEQSMNRYIDFYLEHMQVEETEVLPLAVRLLTPDDWAELDAAFLKNRDPLTGHDPDDAYLPLFKKILNTLPAPLGVGPAVGPALEALAAAGTARRAEGRW